MELRRPTIADKDTILEMLAEFETAGSAMDGGFISKDVDFEDWILRNQDYEAGINLPEGFVPSIQYVSFDQTGRALGFLSLRLRLNDFLSIKAVISDIPFAQPSEERAMPRTRCDLVCRKPQPKIFPRSL